MTCNISKIFVSYCKQVLFSVSIQILHSECEFRGPLAKKETFQHFFNFNIMSLGTAQQSKKSFETNIIEYKINKESMSNIKSKGIFWSTKLLQTSDCSFYWNCSLFETDKLIRIIQD